MNTPSKDAEMPFNLADQLRRAAHERPDHLAITDTVTTRTYAELDSRCDQLANALVAAGVAAGDRVAYLGRNSLEFYEFVFGAAKIGAVSVPLNWRLTGDEIAFLLRDSESVLVVTDPEFERLLPSQVRSIAIGPAYQTWVAAAPTDPPGHRSHPGEAVVQAYTSGTTAMPKGVLITNANYGQTLSNSTALGIDAESVVLAVMPNYHIGGSVFAMFALYTLSTLVVIRAFDAAEMLGHIAKYGVTHFNIAPSMGAMMVDALAGDPPDLSSLVAVVYGGAPITMKQHARLQTALGAPFVQVYGMTENSCISMLDQHDHVGELLKSVGRPVPGVQVSIHDPDTGAELARGERGEVWIHSAGNTPGYWKRPEASARLLTAEGWMRTGDLGRLSADGYLFLVDRVSDLIITGGENVYPGEVERVLITHPAVREVCVLGTPHGTWGEAVSAFIVTEPGTTLTSDELLEWSRDKIAGFRRPRIVVFVDMLPRNAAGKVLRRQLRQDVTRSAP